VPLPKLMFRVGRLLREAISGLAQLEHTRLVSMRALVNIDPAGTSGNTKHNAFKTQAVHSDADLAELMQLLVGNTPQEVYLAPITALRETIDQVRQDTVALLRAQETVYRDTLAALAPERVHAALVQQSGKATKLKDAQLWALYPEHYNKHNLSEQSTEVFRNYMAAAYAEARRL
jgi:predicted component of type VI protein secretion system